jgi:hypothetical protein
MVTPAELGRASSLGEGGGESGGIFSLSRGYWKALGDLIFSVVDDESDRLPAWTDGREEELELGGISKPRGSLESAKARWIVSSRYRTCC